MCNVGFWAMRATEQGVQGVTCGQRSNVRNAGKGRNDCNAMWNAMWAREQCAQCAHCAVVRSVCHVCHVCLVGKGAICVMSSSWATCATCSLQAACAMEQCGQCVQMRAVCNEATFTTGDMEQCVQLEPCLPCERKGARCVICATQAMEKFVKCWQCGERKCTQCGQWSNVCNVCLVGNVCNGAMCALWVMLATLRAQ